MGQDIPTKKSIKYLGIMLGEKLSFGDHIKYAVAKADNRMAAMARIMPNVGGPGQEKRLVLNGIVNSILLYGSPVWAPALRIKKLKYMLGATQRRMLVRVVSGYRTISTWAAQVVAGVPPIHMLIEEEVELFECGQERSENLKAEIRERTLRKWQQQWEEHTETAQWTKTLIKNVVTWTKCKHRRTDYFLTQFLTGHGRFGSYTTRMKIKTDDRCAYCGLTDTPEHTILNCVRWSVARTEVEIELDAELNTGNIIDIMMRDRRSFKAIHGFVRTVLLTKEQEERLLDRV